jgi:DNA-directed RNA polymerase, mitochondrial
MNDIERQIQLEADATQDGVRRYAESFKYHLATDTRPVNDLLAIALRWVSVPMTHKQALYRKGAEKLPQYVVPMLSLSGEKLALITTGTMFNAITRSEFEDGVAPAVTAVAKEIGETCRAERLHDRFRKREIDLVEKLLSRNKNRNARKRAEDIVKKFNDDDYWDKNRLSIHLGDKLLTIAAGFARIDDKPIFQLKDVREKRGRSTITPKRIGLTKTAADWIDNHPAALAFLPSPFYLPMIVPPRPWTSLTDGGYLVTPLKLMKRQGRQAQRLVEKADFSTVFSAVNATQSTPYRVNKDVYRVMRAAWDAGYPLFKLRTQGKGLKNRIQGLQKRMAFRFSLCERFLDELHIYFPHQLDHRGRAYPVPQLMNPQSDDAGRALLEFAEGKRLGERGAYWLAIHLANCYWKKEKCRSARYATGFISTRRKSSTSRTTRRPITGSGRKPRNRGIY